MKSHMRMTSLSVPAYRWVYQIHAAWWKKTEGGHKNVYCFH